MVVMKDNRPCDDDFDIFRDAFGDIAPIRQDKIHFDREASKPQQQQIEEKQAIQSADFYFSDEYVPHLNTEKALSFVREGIVAYEAKQLRRGDFPPEITLDLHGLKQQESKLELAALINYCFKQHIRCACVVHGIGSKVLKQKVPHWLAQHPNVRAFHQAPLEWGGNGAILVLLDIEE